MNVKLTSELNVLTQNGLNDYGKLEKYIIQLQNRNLKENQQMNQVKEKISSIQQLELQLEEKDKDLVLAAELGKALLERNEELTRANERITEEYSHKLEILEQEKHGLRRKLDNLESEYDGRISEYQADIEGLKKEISEQQNLIKTAEKEKTKMVQELIEQNNRLTSELNKSSNTEEQLSNQLVTLKEQVNARRSNFNDHVAQVETLREEVRILSKRKNDIEKRMKILIEEKDSLTLSLEESTERILLLEKSEQDLENKVSKLIKELEESKQINEQLQSKLILNDSLNISSIPVINTNGPYTSLYNEIEMSSSSSFDEDLRSLNGHSSNDNPESDFEDKNWKFRQEMIEVYQGIRRLFSEIQRRKEHSGNFNSSTDSGVPATPEEMHTNDLRPGMVSAAMKELSALLMEATDIPCISCQTLTSERLELEKLKKETIEKDENMKRKNEEIMNISNKVTILEAEIAVTKEERDNLKESVNTNGMEKDEIVKRAWELRDQAVARKNTVEIELAKTRIECMHVNSQLMEAIQQKITLSEQIDQWQLDIQNLLNEHLKEKLSNEEHDKRKSQVKSSLIVTSTPNLINKAKLLKLWKN